MELIMRRISVKSFFARLCLHFNEPFIPGNLLIIRFSLSSCEKREDEEIKNILEGSENEIADLRFHQKCYDRYTHTNDLEAIIRKRQ